MKLEKLSIIKYLLKKSPRGDEQLGRVKRQIAKKFKVATISNIDLLQLYRQALLLKKVKQNKTIERLLKTREIRTLSGVAPVAVLTKPYPCPGRCVFCPAETAMPKSYLSNEPAVMRAIGNDFDPYRQVKSRLDALRLTGHNTDKVELIIMGGTWSYLPKSYQNWFIKRCFDALNNTTVKVEFKSNNTLIAVQKVLTKNESAKHRCVGLTLETRPDYINLAEVKRMRQLGCTKVELGIQAIDDQILKLNSRGHTIKQAIIATKLLKNAGFKSVYHMMPNLFGSSPAKDFKMFKQLFADSNWQPDMLKIYPCVVVPESKLYQWWKKGKFKPYSDKQLFSVLLKMKQVTPEYVRIIRLIRDIPQESISAGNKISNLRQSLQKKLTELDKRCRCIRCREIGAEDITGHQVNNKIINYQASGGEEYFLSFVTKESDKLLAFLRLRLTPETDLPELKNCALIREVHTYGEAAPLLKDKVSNQTVKLVQHSGFGKKLMAQAENIAQVAGYKKIAVIAAVGVRKYYRQLGYDLVGTYMIKNIIRHSESAAADEESRGNGIKLI